ncbi:MAG: class I SAM-dependent methyltransferase [Actinomycetota bacterium]
MDPRHRSVIKAEFDRSAATFAERTKGRFDDMNVVLFSRVRPGATVVEVGSGTGNFLALFEEVAAHLVGVDVTEAMLRTAQRSFPQMSLVLGDGGRMPLASRSADLVSCAQMLHHVPEPLPLIKEMARVCAPEGHALILDQAATERYEEIAFMNQLEVIRDPSHAMSRPPSALRILVRRAGLEIVDERIVDSEQRMSTWMAPGEFPQERFEQVEAFIEEFGHETGMSFERDGNDWVFNRRRMMILAARSSR